MNTKHRNKSILPLAAVAGLALSLVPAAQAALSLDNPSFEAPERNGAFPGGIQPTGWDVPIGGNYVEIEARWSALPLGVFGYKAGPTDGDQVLYFDKRPAIYTSSAEQSVGTVADVGATTLSLTFDARLGEYDGNDGIENATTNFVAYILVNDVELATWTSTLGAYNAGAGPRLIPNITELGSPANPAPAASADLMGHFSLDLDVSGLDSAHDVVVGFRYESNSTTEGNYNSRVYVDNVAVQGVPEPSTTFAITSITLVDGNWQLTLEGGEPNTAYEFYSSTTLDFPGTQVTGLTAGDPAVGTITDGFTKLTTNDSGNGTVQMSLGVAPANFVRAVGP